MANHRIHFSGLITHVSLNDDLRRAVLVDEPLHDARLFVTDSLVTEGPKTFKRVGFLGSLRIYDLTDESCLIETAPAKIQTDTSFDTRVPNLSDVLLGNNALHDEIAAGQKHFSVKTYVDYKNGLLSTEDCFDQEIMFSPATRFDPRCIAAAVVLTVTVDDGLRISDSKDPQRYVDIGPGAEIRITNNSGGGNHFPAYLKLAKFTKMIATMNFTGRECINCTGIDEAPHHAGEAGLLSPSVQCTNTQWP